MNKTKVHLGIIQETLLIPLWARACQLQAVDPIIVVLNHLRLLQRTLTNSINLLLQNLLR